jgi:putative DNA primase/helicase
MVIAQKIRTRGAAAELAAALDRRRSGQGWLARCRAHHDRRRSLSIADGADGRLLLHCFAACSWSAIRDALRARPLWPEPRTRTRAHQTYRKARDPLHAAERCLVRKLS